jgi:hypothetical protein
MMGRTIPEASEASSMIHETTTLEPDTRWRCPKDGAAMEARGGRDRVRRCPQCGGVFVDVEEWRRGAAGRPPAWAPFALSLLMSVGMTLLVRRLRRRPKDRMR